VYESPLNEAEGVDIITKFNTSVQVLAAGSKVDQTVSTIFDMRRAAEEAISRGGKPEWLIPEDQREQADKNATALTGLDQAANIVQKGSGVMSDAANATLALKQAGIEVPQAA
jgi:hypothetical protein